MYLKLFSCSDLQLRNITRGSKAIGTRKNSSNSTYAKMTTRLPSSDCIPWLVVGIAECLGIVILNVITIIVILKQRQLQRRSTYLIIHLAIVDFLSGAVSGPVIIEREVGENCDLWEYNFKIYSFPLANLFPVSSLINLAVISLERAHATFRPFKHLVIKKRVYGVAIAAMWLITIAREFVPYVIYHKVGSHVAIFVINFSILLFWSICIVVICVSYISIFIKVRFSSHPQHHGATDRERKLTATLVFVTLASELSWLPFTVFTAVSNVHPSSFSLRSHFHIRMALAALVGANSLANPIVYALRLPEFKTGVAKLFRCVPNHPNAAVLPLGNL